MRAKFFVITINFAQGFEQVNSVAFLQFQSWMQTDWAWSRATDTESYAFLDPIDAQKNHKNWGLHIRIGFFF